jgi:hypothetical protein
MLGIMSLPTQLFGWLKLYAPYEIKLLLDNNK